MKQLSLSFYLYITIYFIGSFINLEALEYISMQKRCLDKDLLEMFTTLRVIKKIHKDLQDQYHELQNSDYEQQKECEKEEDFIVDIMIILTGTYEKIIGVTVTYYLTLNTPIQQNLHNSIAQILAEDSIKIISILGKKLMYFVFNLHLSWQEKLWYCACVISIITIIKLGIDQIPQQIPQPIQPPFPYYSQEQSYNPYNINENHLYNVTRIQQEKSGCSIDKFDN
ncbi:MAG: hypothetical protein JO129_01565 [Candidatus Dependentiae bacterium]|nr:hypothetical protein [Candidatus Dependentiae bacterium]